MKPGAAAPPNTQGRRPTGKALELKKKKKQKGLFGRVEGYYSFVPGFFFFSILGVKFCFFILLLWSRFFETDENFPTNLTLFLCKFNFNNTEEC